MIGITEAVIVVRPTSTPHAYRVGLSKKTWLAITLWSVAPLVIMRGLFEYADRTSQQIEKTVSEFDEFNTENYNSPQE